MATTQNVLELINDIQRNSYFLPEFQRGFRWSADQIKKYFQSLYRRYPTGSFLVWKSENPPRIRGGVIVEDRHFSRLILDGQQRLTTLFTIIKGVPPPWFEGKPPGLICSLTLSPRNSSIIRRPSCRGSESG